MRVLVCGARDWSDIGSIRRTLAALPPDTVVIHGAARGADSLAGEAARELGLRVRAFPADWARYGKAAGPVRNRQMLVEGKPDRVLAFHADLAGSKGTADMVRQARAAGVAVRIYVK
jgi:hypothetical protein